MLENTAAAMIHCGREISDEEIAQIQETVSLCRGLSRKELALTIAENLVFDFSLGPSEQSCQSCVRPA